MNLRRSNQDRNSNEVARASQQTSNESSQLPSSMSRTLLQEASQLSKSDMSKQNQTKDGNTKSHKSEKKRKKRKKDRGRDSAKRSGSNGSHRSQEKDMQKQFDKYIDIPVKQQKEMPSEDAYSPASLRHVFFDKVNQIRPLLKPPNIPHANKLLYFLENMCKEFLAIIVEEKPNQIQLNSMNFMNFDKLILDMNTHFNIQSKKEDIEQIETEIDNTALEVAHMCLKIEREQDHTVVERRALAMEQKEFVEATITSGVCSQFDETGTLSFDRDERSKVHTKHTDILKAIIESEELYNAKAKQYDSLQKAHDIVNVAKEKVEQITHKNEELNQKMKGMAYEFYKELQSLRTQVETDPSLDAPKLLDVRYFTGLEILDEKAKVLMNRRLDELTNKFNRQVGSMQETNQRLRDQIRAFERLCKDGNVGISINELNPDDMVKKLSFVSSDPDLIWKAIEKNYGFGFFNKMIEKEFGINPDTQEELGNQFAEELKEIRVESMEMIQKLNEEAVRRLEKSRKQQFDTENELSKVRHELEILENKYRKETALSGTNSRVPTSKNSRTSFEYDSPTRQMSQVTNLAAKFQEGSYNSNKEKLIREIETLQFSNSQLQKQFDLISEEQCLLKADYDELLITQKMHNKGDIEVETIQKAFKSTNTFLKTIESDNEILRTQFKRLQTELPGERLLIIKKQPPFKVLKQRTEFTRYEIMSNIQNGVSSMFKSTSKHQGMITDIRGLERDIMYKPTSNDMDVPMYEIGLQTENEMGPSVMTETELKGSDLVGYQQRIQNLEDEMDFMKQLKEKQVLKRKQSSSGSESSSDETSDSEVSENKDDTLFITKVGDTIETSPKARKKGASNKVSGKNIMIDNMEPGDDFKDSQAMSRKSRVSERRGKMLEKRLEKKRRNTVISAINVRGEDQLDADVPDVIQEGTMESDQLKKEIKEVYEGESSQTKERDSSGKRKRYHSRMVDASLNQSSEIRANIAGTEMSGDEHDQTPDGVQVKKPKEKGKLKKTKKKLDKLVSKYKSCMRMVKKHKRKGETSEMDELMEDLLYDIMENLPPEQILQSLDPKILLDQIEGDEDPNKLKTWENLLTQKFGLVKDGSQSPQREPGGHTTIIKKETKFLKPKFNIIPFNLKNMENILNRVSMSSQAKLRDKEVQTLDLGMPYPFNNSAIQQMGANKDSTLEPSREKVYSHYGTTQDMSINKGCETLDSQEHQLGTAETPEDDNQYQIYPRDPSTTIFNESKRVQSSLSLRQPKISSQREVIPTINAANMGVTTSKHNRKSSVMIVKSNSLSQNTFGTISSTNTAQGNKRQSMYIRNKSSLMAKKQSNLLGTMRSLGKTGKTMKANSKRSVYDNFAININTNHNKSMNATDKLAVTASSNQTSGFHPEPSLPTINTKTRPSTKPGHSRRVSHSKYEELKKQQKTEWITHSINKPRASYYQMKMQALSKGVTDFSGEQAQDPNIKLQGSILKVEGHKRQSSTSKQNVKPSYKVTESEDDHEVIDLGSKEDGSKDEDVQLVTQNSQIQTFDPLKAKGKAKEPTSEGHKRRISVLKTIQVGGKTIKSSGHKSYLHTRQVSQNDSQLRQAKGSFISSQSSSSQMKGKQGGSYLEFNDNEHQASFQEYYPGGQSNNSHSVSQMSAGYSHEKDGSNVIVSPISEQKAQDEQTPVQSSHSQNPVKHGLSTQAMLIAEKGGRIFTGTNSNITPEMSSGMNTVKDSGVADSNSSNFNNDLNFVMNHEQTHGGGNIENTEKL